MKKLASWILLGVLSSGVLFSCGSPRSAASTPSSTPSPISSPSSSQEDNVSLTLDKEVTSLSLGSTLQLSYAILPQGNYEVLFSSSDTSILTVSSSGLVTPMAKGKASVTAVVKDHPSASDSLELEVVDAPLTLKDVLNELKSLQEKEMSSVDTGSFLYQEGTASSSYSYTVYQSSLQIEGQGSKIRYYKTGNDLTALTLTSSSITETTLGTVGTDMTQETADSYLSAFCLHQSFGASGVLDNVLSAGDFASGLSPIGEEETEGGTVYSLSASFSSGEGKSALYHVNEASFTVNKGNLVEASYSKKSYLGLSEAPEEGSTPDQSESFSASLHYGERKASDEKMLDRSDYLIQSFALDTSLWVDGEAKLYVGSSFPLEMKDVLPEIHLEDNLRVPENGIGNPSVIAAEKRGDITYVTALKAGTSTLTVETSYMKSVTLTVEVLEVPPSSIEISATALTEIRIGQKAPYKVTLMPASLSDKSFTAAFEEEAMSEIAELTLDEVNSCFYLEGKKAGEVTVKVAASMDPAITAEITVTVKKDKDVTITAGKTTLAVGQSATYPVAVVLPDEVSDRSFTAAFEEEAMSSYATLTVSDSSFTLKGVAEGSVTVLVKLNADETITASLTVEIQAASLSDPKEELIAIMASHTYAGSFSSNAITATFSSDLTGSLSIANGNAYTFTYAVGTLGDNGATITFSNVAQTEGTASKPFFTGANYSSAKKNKVSADGLSVSLNICSLNYKGTKTNNYITLTAQ